jgi:hypothetical protein
LQTIFQGSLILNLQARFRNLQRRPILLPDDSGPAEDLGQKVPDIIFGRFHLPPVKKFIPLIIMAYSFTTSDRLKQLFIHRILPFSLLQKRWK